MIQEQDLEKIFYNAIVIPPKDDSSVFLGSLSPTDAPDGLAAVMKNYTSYIDGLLQSLPLSEVQRIELTMLRSFTYDEYICLFSVTKEREFVHYPVFRVLLITTDRERKLFISNSRDESFEAYVALLESWTKINNPFLHTFIYEARANSTDF